MNNTQIKNLLKTAQPHLSMKMRILLALATWLRRGDIESLNVTIFLASDEPRYIVAQTLVVDGGTISWVPFSEQFRKYMLGSIGKGYVPGI